MDIEQLKLILEAASAAGDGAMQVVFIWFGYRLFDAVLGGTLIGGALIGIYKITYHAVKNQSFITRMAEATEEDLDYSHKQNKVLNFVRKSYKGGR